MRGWRRHLRVPPLVVDAAMAVAGAIVTVWLSSSYYAPGSRPLDAYACVLTVLVAAPLAVRRLAPVAVLVASCTVMVWVFVEGYTPSFVVFGPLLAAFTVAASRRFAVAAAGGALTAATLAYSGTRYGAPVGATVAEATLVTAVVVFFGVGARRLADRNRRLADLSEQLRHEREERARLAVTQERVRIARELHDVVAHHMSVISVQAGMAQYVLPSDPVTASTALGTIGDTSREALDELRRILSLLRTNGFDEDSDGTEAAHTAPGLAGLGDLVERVQRAGVPVEVVVTGPLRALSPGADLCAYRIVQESLTNVIKHARPASARVTLSYGPAALTVTVTDDGRRPPPQPNTGGGHGLVGMRERARVYGGSLTVGPGPERGFEVILTLPLEGYPAAPRAGATRPDS